MIVKRSMHTSEIRICCIQGTIDGAVLYSTAQAKSNDSPAAAKQTSAVTRCGPAADEAVEELKKETYSTKKMTLLQYAAAAEDCR